MKKSSSPPVASACWRWRARRPSPSRPCPRRSSRAARPEPRRVREEAGRALRQDGRNHDGKVTKEELVALRKERQGCALHQARRRQGWQAFPRRVRDAARQGGRTSLPRPERVSRRAWRARCEQGRGDHQGRVREFGRWPASDPAGRGSQRRRHRRRAQGGVDAPKAHRGRPRAEQPGSKEEGAGDCPPFPMPAVRRGGRARRSGRGGCWTAAPARRHGFRAMLRAMASAGGPVPPVPRLREDSSR